MHTYENVDSGGGVPGAIAPAGGNTAAGVAPARRGGPAGFPPGDEAERRQQDAGATDAPVDLGPNNERLHDAKPELVNALRELVRQYRQEGIVARRHEIRRIRQAQPFWPSLHYASRDSNDMNWHLSVEQSYSD